MNILDDVLGDFDLVKENIGGLFSNLTLLSLLLTSLKDEERPFPKTKLTFNRTYDYVIVGGGTAGCVMANRLSELPCVSVILLEAGGCGPWLTEVPAAARVMLGTYIDWLYETTPQKYCAFGQKGRKVKWNSGKVMGGSSTLNAMLPVRGNEENYNDWVTVGATGWSYKDVLPYFLKLEDNKNIEDLDKGYHQREGPMTIEKPKYEPEIKDPILEATAAMGYEVRDINGERQTGIYDLQGTLRNGRRCSTAKAYLVPAEDRPNLTILKYAFAKKIRFRNNTAICVEFDFNGIPSLVCANKEIIISSGSVRATQILMLSGIGPKAHLDELGITVLSDLLVGQNLQDHYGAMLPFLVNDTITNVVQKNLNPVNVGRYTAKREGPLASPAQMTVIAFLDGMNTNVNSPDFPRQELYFAEYDPVDALKNMNLKRGVYSQYYAKYISKPMYTCIASLLQPYSRGEILLNSANPYEYPIINPNYYEDERDLMDVVEGLKICLAIGTSKEMQKVQSTPLDKPYPGCEKEVANETAYLTCLARQVVMTIWHPVGTCRMGRRGDPKSVVDPQLRVIGVEHLRVVCAAIMPIIPSANTNIPTMMIAEKIADEMKKDIKC